MTWLVRGTEVPDGADIDLWIADDGMASAVPLPDAEPLPGRYVAYGLVDAHAHPFVGVSDELFVHDQAQVLAVLAAYAAAGVTAVRDAGSPLGAALDLEVPPGLPRVDAAGRFLATEGRYPAVLTGRPVPADQLVDAGLGEVARGARWVKVIGDETDTGSREPMYDVDTVRRLVDAAHAAGARVAVHCLTGFAGDLVDIGIDSLEHGVAIGEREIAVMAAGGIAWTPTIGAYGSDPETLAEPARSHVAAMQRNVREMLPRAQAAGVRILAGTDVSGPLHREVALLAAYGLSPTDALRAATTNAYEFLRIDGAGRRDRPNLVTYDADPREDPAVLARPAAVLIDGRRVR